ncbi:MAG: hypothetical protein WAM14_09495 [Candidatus Nitrosopolaris sp.]
MDVASYHDDHNAIILLQELVDRNTCRIIMSTMDLAKTASQICQENELPISSTYKKIRNLYEAGLISVEKINIDSKGKKVLLYRSRIKSLEISLREGEILLQFHKNDLARSSSTIAAATVCAIKLTGHKQGC